MLAADPQACRPHEGEAGGPGGSRDERGAGSYRAAAENREGSEFHQQDKSERDPERRHGVHRARGGAALPRVQEPQVQHGQTVSQRGGRRERHFVGA